MREDTDRCYQTLGLPRGVSKEDVKQAYRDLVKVWHPDRFTNDPKLQDKAQEKLKEINKAYTALQTRRSSRRTPAVQPAPPAHGLSAAGAVARRSHVVFVVSQAPPRFSSSRWFYSLWLPAIAAAIIAGLIYNGIGVPAVREPAAPIPAVAGAPNPNSDLSEVIGVTREAAHELNGWLSHLADKMEGIDRPAPLPDGATVPPPRQTTRASPDR